MNEFNIDDEVVATPTEHNDFEFEFVGVIVGYRGDYICVRDQNGDVFDCSPDQLVKN